MSRLKTFLKYIIWIVAFALLSDFLIYMGLNSTYKDIYAKDNIVSQVQIETAEATAVNGRIYGKVKNDETNNLNGKYIKINLYSARDNLLGTTYVQVSNLDVNGEDTFKVYFKIQDVKYYEILIVNEMEEIDTNIFLSQDLKTKAIYTLLLYMIIH